QLFAEEPCWVTFQPVYEPRIARPNFKTRRLSYARVHELTPEPRQIWSRPSAITRSSTRQQKSTSLSASLVADKQIVNGWAGRNGATNFTAGMPMRRESAHHSPK